MTALRQEGVRRKAGGRKALQGSQSTFETYVSATVPPHPEAHEGHTFVLVALRGTGLVNGAEAG